MVASLELSTVLPHPALPGLGQPESRLLALPISPSWLNPDLFTLTKTSGLALSGFERLRFPLLFKKGAALALGFALLNPAARASLLRVRNLTNLLQ